MSGHGVVCLLDSLPVGQCILTMYYTSIRFLGFLRALPRRRQRCGYGGLEGATEVDDNSVTNDGVSCPFLASRDA